MYLWIQKDSDDFAESTARIVSPIYRNSGSNCKLRFQYYISGNMNNDYVKPSIHPVGSEMPIVMDYLTVNEEWKPHEIGIGRKRGQFQVCKCVQYNNIYYYVCCGFQIVFLKSPNSVFDAKVAIDDVELLDCDLPLPQSECPDVRCGNGVSCAKPFTHSVHNSFHICYLRPASARSSSVT